MVVGLLNEESVVGNEATELSFQGINQVIKVPHFAPACMYHSFVPFDISVRL